MILDSDTNVIYFSELVLNILGGLGIVTRIRENNISVKFIPATVDIWARDYMPIQIDNQKFIGYEYCPDYLYPNFSSRITNQARVCDKMGFDTFASGLIIDGGNVVKTSKGIIMVDKVFNENSHLSRIELINQLETAFQSEIIFLPWNRSEYYGHADGIVREIFDGTVLLTNYHRYSKKYALQFEQILSRYFDVKILDFNVEKQHKHNWCYINFLRIGNTIFLPQLTPMRPSINRECTGDDVTADKTEYIPSEKIVEEDAQAVEQFRYYMPDCQIIPISCPQIVKEGGALNCISWNIKAPKLP